MTSLPQKSTLAEASKKHLLAIAEVHEELVAAGGGVLVVGGARGVGKALLVGELRKELAPRGRLVLFGRAESAGSQPYAVLREPAAQALAFLEGRGLAEEFLDQHTRALSVLLPQLLPGTAPRAKDKAAFFEALRALFLDLGAQSPVTAPMSLLLSDLHAADDDTRDAVRFLAQHLFAPEAGDPQEAFAGVLVVATRTDDDASAAFSRALTAGRRARLFEVGGMSRDQLARYLEGHPLLDRLLEASHGRPEDVDELLESLPRDTDALLLSRVAALDPIARRAVHALAVLGRPASVDLLAAVSKAHPGETASALGRLVDQRLMVRRLQNGELLFALGRAHHQEVVLLHLPPDEREAVHLAVADVLEQRGGDGHEGLLAFHFLRGSAPRRGVKHALAACERLLLTFAYGTVVDLVERALPVAEPDEKLALYGHLVEAQRLRGEPRAALQAAEEMLALASERQRPGVLRRVGEIHAARSEHRAAMEALEDALAQARALPPAGEADLLPEGAAVLAAMADVAYSRGDLESAERCAADAIAQAPSAPMAFRLRVSNVLGKVAYGRERFDDAEARFLSNLKHAEEHGLEHEAVLARINTGLARHRRGANEEAREMLERALLGARAVGDLHNESFALLNLGAIFQRTGELVSALESYRAALARFSRLGNRTEVRRAAWNLANVYTSIGHYEAAQGYLDQSRRLADQDDSDRGRALVASTEGDIALNQGQAAAALAAYERAREMFLRLGEAASRVHETTAKAAWAAVLLHDLDQAARRMAELPPSKAGTIAHARAQAVEGALLASGDDTDAASHGLALIAAAVDELERLRAFDDGWRTLVFLAERFDARGDRPSAEGARVRARAMVERASAGLPEELRAIHDADPVRALLFGRKPTLPPVAAAERRTTERANAFARRPEWDARYAELIGRSPALLRVFDRLDRIAKTRSPTVLIRGESGTGKELVAASVHRLGDRAGGPFVRVNCAALVETLLMSELFGHEKGSFTGALARKIGRFELARGGTIFLDEIGDISPKTQVSLLRVLQERQFERVGGTQTITTDAAVICATHRDLEAMVKDGSFREDLYYRLRGVVVEVPALRERPEDIPLLALRFLQKARDELGRAPVALSAAAEELLMRYRWPGNIRELQNVVRSVALFCEGDVVDVEHLAEIPELFSAQGQLPAVPRPAPPPLSTPSSAPQSAPQSVPPSAPAGPPRASAPPQPSGFSGGDTEGLALGDLKRRLEFEAISNAMRQTGGNITRAAALLKMKRPRLSQIVNGNPELKAIKEASRGEEGDEA